MPRDIGTGLYHYPDGTPGNSGQTVFSARYNTFINDLSNTLNTALPLNMGGTGATSGDEALTKIPAEKATQLVADYNTHVWFPGSFRSAAAANGAQNATAAFAGIAYINEALANPPTNQNVVIEARDLTDGMLYIKRKTAGMWGAWDTERSTIYAAPFDALAYNGMQVNGSMEVSQETTAVAVSTGQSKYAIDGWNINTGGVQVVTCQKNATAARGFVSSLQISSSPANPSPAAGDYCVLTQIIEGYRMSRLAFGSTNASPITIGFWIFSTKTGLHSGSVRNAANNRSYVFTFTINAGSTFEYKTVTIPGDITGTWPTTNVPSLLIGFTPLAGSSFQTTPGAWTAGNFIAATGTVNVLSSTSDFILVTGVVVLPGTQAPTAAQSSLIMRPFDQELQICKRYYEKSYNYQTAPRTAVGAGANGIFYPVVPNAAVYMILTTPYSVEKRAAPTMLYYNGNGSSGGYSYYDGTWHDTGGGLTTAFSATQRFASFNAGLGSASVTMIGFDYTADARL